jgi:signal peptidase II
LRQSKKRNSSGRPAVLLLVIPVAVLILDILTKLWMSYHSYQVGRFLSLAVITNTGAGFSTFQNQNRLLMFVVIIILGAVLYHYNTLKHPMSQIGASLIVGGGLGNLVDRIFYGHVIDFIDFKVWPVFNLADSAITIGIILLIFAVWKFE